MFEKTNVRMSIVFESGFSFDGPAKRRLFKRFAYPFGVNECSVTVNKREKGLLPQIFFLVLLICQTPRSKHKQHRTLVGHRQRSTATKTVYKKTKDEYRTQKGYDYCDTCDVC